MSSASGSGVPVAIDVLGNDGLPAGQEIRIVAVTLPFKGKLVFNPDGTITYTPNMGFVGFDDFTYTIGNDRGGTSKATVVVEVQPASVTESYANGYGYRRRPACSRLRDTQCHYGVHTAGYPDG